MLIPVRLPPRLRTVDTQAATVWQWFNYAETLAASRGKTLLRINIDETSVCLHPGVGKGAVFVTRKWLRAGGGQHVPKWKQRRYMSHVGVICDRPDVQAVLPQFVIGNQRTLLKRDIAALRRGRPMNVRLIRQKSAWSNSKLTASLVRQIAAALAGHGVLAEGVQVVLILDAVRIHYTPEVLRACKAAHFWLIVVPAKMTLLLQPLDTHVFALYKACLQSAYQSARARCTSPKGDVSISEFLPCVDDAIRSVLEGRPWGSAFNSDGFGHSQLLLGDRVKKCLQLDAAAVAPSTCPTEAQLRCCFPRRARPAFDFLLSMFEEAATPPPLPPVVARPDDDALVSLHGVAPTRILATRSRHRLERADAAVARLSPGMPEAPPLLRRYRHPPDLD